MDEILRMLERDEKKPPVERPRTIEDATDELWERLGDSRNSEGFSGKLLLSEIEQHLTNTDDVATAKKNMDDLGTIADNAENPNQKLLFDNLYELARDRYRKLRNPGLESPKPNRDVSMEDKWGPKPEERPLDKWDVDDPTHGYDPYGETPAQRIAREKNEDFEYDVTHRQPKIGITKYADGRTEVYVDHKQFGKDVWGPKGPSDADVQIIEQIIRDPAAYKKSMGPNATQWQKDLVDIELGPPTNDIGKLGPQKSRTVLDALNEEFPGSNLKQDKPKRAGQRSNETSEQYDARLKEESKKYWRANKRTRAADDLWRLTVSDHPDKPGWTEANKKAEDLINSVDDIHTLDSYESALDEWVTEHVNESDLKAAKWMSDLRKMVNDRINKLANEGSKKIKPPDDDDLGDKSKVWVPKKK